MAGRGEFTKIIMHSECDECGLRCSAKKDG